MGVMEVHAKQPVWMEDHVVVLNVYAELDIRVNSVENVRLFYVYFL